MGDLYNFHCSCCGYDADVSGGDDAGMMVLTTTIQCEDCQDLQDIITAWVWGDVASPKNGTPKFECPKSPDHPIKKWEAGGQCPRCQVMMENKGQTVSWD